MARRDPDWVLEYVREFPDGGLRRLLGIPGEIASLFERVAGELAGEIDLASLERAPEVWIDPGFRRREIDLLYRAALRAHLVRIYLVLEVQSSPDRWMPLRFLERIARIWEREERRLKSEKVSIDREQGPLSPIAIVLVHTGPDRWEGPADLAGIVGGGPGLARFLPAFEVLVLDLRHDRLPRLEASELPVAFILRAIRAEGANEAEFARALAEAAEEHDRLFETVESRLDVRQRKEGVAMKGTLAERLKGEGRADGSVRALQDLLLRQLEQKFGSVSEESRRAVRSASDPDRLFAWFDRVIPARTIEDVIGS